MSVASSCFAHEIFNRFYNWLILDFIHPKTTLCENAKMQPYHLFFISESPPHIPGPINGNPYAIVNQAMKMKCRAEEERSSPGSDYPGETKMAKYNGDNVFQFPVVISEQQMRDEDRKAAMDEILGSLGVDPVAMKRNGDRTTTVTVTKQVTQRNPAPPQRQSSFKATEKIKMKKGTGPGVVSPTSPVQNFEVPLVQTAPNEGQNVYYASHYAASQPGKVKAKLHIDPHSGGQISPTASPELISNRKMLLDVIEGDSGDELEVEVTEVRKTEVRVEDSDTESEDEISFHESPTLPRRGNVAEKVQFLSKSVAFSPPPDSEGQDKRKNTSVPLIGLTHLAATDVTDRIAKHNEKSLAAGQVMTTANMVLYSSKQPPKRVVEFNPDAHEHSDEQGKNVAQLPYKLIKTVFTISGCYRALLIGKHLEVYFARIVVALCPRSGQILSNLIHLLLNTRWMYTINNEFDPATAFPVGVVLQVLGV